MKVPLSKNDKKIFKYLAERKRPSQIKTIAEYFIVSDATVRNSLKWLVVSGLVVEFKVGSKKFFKVANEHADYRL